MLRSKLGKDLSPDYLSMLLDVRTPEDLINGALVLSADVEQWQLGFTAKSLALENSRKNYSPIDRCHIKLGVYEAVVEERSVLRSISFT